LIKNDLFIRLSLCLPVYSVSISIYCMCVHPSILPSISVYLCVCPSVYTDLLCMCVLVYMVYEDTGVNNNMGIAA